jgi:3-oxoacyl-(acyl-carrier-protein) synthase
MPRLAQLAIVAAQQAVAGGTRPEPARTQAALGALSGFYGAERIGVSFGTALGALDLTVEFMTQYIAGGLAAASPATFPYTVLNTPAALIAMELGLRGPNVTVNHRDLSATEAIASACDLLLCGRADAVLAGGADELSESLLHAYRSLSVLAGDAGGAAASAAADRGSLPRPAAGPYDRRRSGLCPGEGAALFLLERAEAAEQRGAHILARIAGYGRGGEARARLGWHGPRGAKRAEHPGGTAAVQSALAQAGLALTALHSVAGGGNGTALDRLETDILRAALGPAAEQVAVSSILGRTGEWPTSAAVRVAQALFLLGEQALPSCVCEEPDEQAALPGLTRGRTAQAATIGSVLVPSFAQGGGNLALVLTPP